MNHLSKKYCFAPLVFCTLLAAGCGRSSEQGKTSENDERLTIAVIPKGSTHEHWKSVHLGAQKAADELDVEIIWKGPLKEDDREEQLQIFETFMASKVDAIAIAPIDDRVFLRPVSEAKSMGIPTVIFDSGVEGDEHVSYVATDNFRGGVLCAERLGELLGGRGKLIMLRYHEGSAATLEREEGFLETIRSKFPGIEILSSNQYAGATTESGFQMSENLLTRFSGFDAVFTPNETSTFGFLRALQERGLAGKVVFIGFDTSSKLVDALRAREIQGLAVQHPFTMGYEAVFAAVNYLRGNEIEQSINTGVTFATPDNMDEPRIRELLMHDFSRYFEKTEQ